MVRAQHSRPRRGLPRPVAGLLVILVLVAVIAGAGVAGSRLLDSFGGGPPDYAGQGSGAVRVRIVSGDTATEIGRALAECDVVKSVEAFTEAALDNERSRGIQPGVYILRAQMSAESALALLLDPDSKQVGTVVVPEGLTVSQTLERITEGTELRLADLRAAAQNTAALDLPAWSKPELEGLLFPATYVFGPDQSAVAALTEMVDRFEQEAATLDLVAGAARLGYTPYEVVTVASLAQREARRKDEYAKVARVIYNRLEIGQRLGIDATVLYGLGRTSGPLTAADLAQETPYNTRLNVEGLPPTPIASPGALALNAALNPAPGDWLYYVLADSDGRQFYTSDYEEFLEQKRKSEKAGLL